MTSDESDRAERAKRLLLAGSTIEQVSALLGMSVADVATLIAEASIREELADDWVVVERDPDPDVPVVGRAWRATLEPLQT